MKWTHRTHALAAGAILLLGAVSVAAPASADATDDVAEASDYRLLYQLDLPDVAAFNQSGITYTVDTSADAGTFDRVAWYVELARTDGPRQWIWVSVDAMSAEPAHAGVPHSGLGIALQQRLDGMNVRTNVPGIQERTDHSGGTMEFWSTNYQTQNAARVPGASDAVYDWGDQIVQAGGYGSMQLHDATGGVTLLAYNRWGIGGAASDLGIGNNVVPFAEGVVHSDWTFRANAAEWSLKRLSVFLRPGPTPPELAITVLQPGPCAVAQRQPGNRAQFAVRGRLLEAVERIEARLVPVRPEWGEVTDWQLVDAAPSGQSFAGTVSGTAGWYDLEVRAPAGDDRFSVTRTGPVGIGEIFVIAGQSNSANHGNPTTRPEDLRVCGFNGTNWAPGADPQPLATGTGGSPWPAFGDAVAARFGVPVGIVSVGVGGTAVDQWRPASPDALYTRLQAQLRTMGPNGFRAVLWHQGESDANRGTTSEDYAQQLSEVIGASRVDAGWDVPWGIARAAYLPGLDQGRIDAILEGQDRVVADDPLVFAGPTTEDLLGADWRYDNVHFNARGLAEHGQRWAQTIELPRCQGFGNDDGCGEPDPEPDVGADAEPEVGADAPSDVEEDLGRDAQGDVAEDVQGDPPTDTTPDLPGDAVEGDDVLQEDARVEDPVPQSAPEASCGCQAQPSSLGWLWKRR